MGFTEKLCFLILFVNAKYAFERFELNINNLQYYIIVVTGYALTLDTEIALIFKFEEKSVLNQHLKIVIFQRRMCIFGPSDYFIVKVDKRPPRKIHDNYFIKMRIEMQNHFFSPFNEILVPGGGENKQCWSNAKKIFFVQGDPKQTVIFEMTTSLLFFLCPI